MNRLDGKIAVITGGAQGLGAAVAHQFAAAGAAGLVLCGRSAQKERAVAAEIAASASIEVHLVAADLAEAADCGAVIAEADARFGRIDILVNAAGLTDRGTLLDTTPDLFDRLFAVNTRAPFFMMQGAARLMIREGSRGRSSISARPRPMPGSRFSHPTPRRKARLRH